MASPHDTELHLVPHGPGTPQHKQTRFQAMFDTVTGRVTYWATERGKAMHATLDCPALERLAGDGIPLEQRLQRHTVEASARQLLAKTGGEVKPCRVCALTLVIESHLTRPGTVARTFAMFTLGRPVPRPSRVLTTEEKDHVSALQRFMADDARQTAKALNLGVAETDGRPVLFGFVAADLLDALHDAVKVRTLPFVTRMPDQTQVSLFWQLSRDDEDASPAQLWDLAQMVSC